METVTPTTGAHVADILRDASARKQSVLIRGAGTKLDWGRPAGPVDTVLDMRGLDRMLAHQHGDLTATFEAGLSLREANAALARHGQWLPLDPAFPDSATIGGLLATNDHGALRQRYGTPRDLVIGVHIATADGTLAKAGGQVVKNVAGYDLSRLMTGSFGSLGAIVSATFKLSPLPAASKTLVISASTGDVLGKAVKKMLASQLEPYVFEVVDDGAEPQLLIRFASLPVVVDAQVEQARTLLAGVRASLTALKSDDEDRVWRAHQGRAWEGSGAVVRLSWLPATLGAVLRELRAMGAPVALVGRAALGAGLARIETPDVDAQARAIGRLRESKMLGNVVLLRGADALKEKVDPWGRMGDRAPLLASIKRALDPQGILNAGRGPL